jgi:glucosamine-6-phosphate deaminase
MEVSIHPSAGAAARPAADAIAELVSRNRAATLGLATGSSPMALYGELRNRVAAGLDLRSVRGFALDEYVGLRADHPQSYHSVIEREVVKPLGLRPDLVSVPDGSASDLSAACALFERRITDAGGIDLQILGIGANGHIGFNEPGSSLSSRTRVKTLTPSTRSSNSRFFGSIDRVPVHCVTQGLGTILESRAIFLFASGEGKAAAVAAAVEGPVSSMCPASVLQLHPHAVLFLDEAAASALRNLDYYRYVQSHKLSVGRSA